MPIAEHVDILSELSKAHPLPPGCDSWALRTKGNYTLDYRADQWTEASGPFLEHDGVSPIAAGDGLCVAFSYLGLATVKLPAQILNLVAYAESDVLSRPDPHTARVRKVYVVETLDGIEYLRVHGMGTRLVQANLSGTDLRGAELYGADLRDADLTGADLSGATLYGANLSRSRLNAANLWGTDLRCANLQGANLTGAKMDGSTLVGLADLQGSIPRSNVLTATFAFPFL